MPFSSGTYSLPSGNPVVTGTTISSSTTNTTNSDIATALSSCILKDGTQTVTANIPMASHKITGLSAGTTAGDSVEYGGSPSFTNLAYTGTLTGSTGILNIGSGQLYKDASGNVGIGTSSPSYKLSVNGVGNFYSTASGLGRVFLGDPGDPSGYIGMYRSALGAANSTVSGNALNFASFDGYTFNASSAAFGSQTERMRLDSSGNLLVGTTSASTTSGVGVKIPPTGNNIAVVSTSTTNSDNNFLMYSTGASAFRFYVDWSGQIHATNGTIGGVSDVSLKTNIRNIETGLAEVLALQPRRFDWKNGDGENIAGFIAQEVEQILPDLVIDALYTENETKKSLLMGQMVPTLVKAIQEQQTLIEALTARLTALEAK